MTSSQDEPDRNRVQEKPFAKPSRGCSSVEHSIFMKKHSVRSDFLVRGRGSAWMAAFLSSSSQTSAPRGAKSGSTRGIIAAAGSLGPLPSTCPAAPKVREFVRKVARNSLASAAGREAGEGRCGCRCASGVAANRTSAATEMAVETAIARAFEHQPSGAEAR